MMKLRLLILFGVLLLADSVSAQSDPIELKKIKWEVKKLAPGVKLKTSLLHNALFNSNQNISMVEIKARKRNILDLAYSPKELIPTNTFGERANALAAMNGTFFDMANGGSVDYIGSDNERINGNRLNKNGERAAHQRAAVVIDKGQLSIHKWDGSPDWEEKLQAEDVMVSGPLLILDEQAEKLDSSAFNTARHPRTAIAVTKKGRVLLLAVDGRQENAAGMSLFELSSFLSWLKAEDAINLDGGGSTALWVNAPGYRGIVNYPSDNKKWDHEGVRKVANVILLKRK